MVSKGDGGKFPIKKISIADQVYEVLLDKINNKTWVKGEKLPSETELASTLGVNRVTVRMALQRLNVLGLVETRVGEGSFVTDASFSDNISEIFKYYMVPDVIDDVEEFRRLIETRCLELAVLNASDTEIDELEEYYHRYEKCKKAYAQNGNNTTFDDLLDADFEFHRKLCTMSHNLLYSYAYAMAKEPICRFIGFIISERDERKKEHIKNESPKTTDGHLQICDALRNRDVKACRKHFQKLVDYDIVT
jgi:GntR family transcriptional repressor for pyruvate dehydrogenase complex